MTEAQVYLWVMLGNIQACFILIMFVFGVIGLFTSGFLIEAVVVKRCSRKLLLFLLLWILYIPIFLGTFLIPDSKQYALIKVFPKIVNSDFSKELTGDAKEMYNMAKSYLKETMTKK